MDSLPVIPGGSGLHDKPEPLFPVSAGYIRLKLLRFILACLVLPLGSFPRSQDRP